MNGGLLGAAALLVFIALVHSILGERYIISRLLRRENLPKLFGSDWFTKQTLRFAWHITSLAWLGFAALLFLVARDGELVRGAFLQTVAATFFVTALVAALASRGRHLAWIVFLAVALLCILAV